MQSKGLLRCLQQPINGPCPEPNKSSCHSPNLFQICWKNQLLVPSSLSICLVQMEHHNLQQAAFCNVVYLKLPQNIIDTFKFWSKKKTLHESPSACSVLCVGDVTVSLQLICSVLCVGDVTDSFTATYIQCTVRGRRDRQVHYNLYVMYCAWATSQTGSLQLVG